MAFDGDRASAKIHQRSSIWISSGKSLQCIGSDASSNTAVNPRPRGWVMGCQAAPRKANCFIHKQACLRVSVILISGGFCFGILFGFVTRQVLKIIKRGGHRAPEQLALSLAMAYLVFYTAQIGTALFQSVWRSVRDQMDSRTKKVTDINRKDSHFCLQEQLWDAFLKSTASTSTFSNVL